MRRKIGTRRSAFTLIEVLLVAGILALLAAFAVPQLMGMATTAKIKLAESAVGRNGPIAKALDAFKWNMNRFPDTDEGLEILMMEKEEVDDERFDGPYLNNDKVEDPWGNPFEYRSPGDIREKAYDLWSWGPDVTDDEGKEGSDDIKNWIEK